MATQLMTKNPDTIRQTALASLENGQMLLSKNYLAEMGNYAPMLSTANEHISYGLDVRLFQVERIVLENKQSALESLTAAYTALGSAGYSVFLLLKSDGKETQVYLGARGLPKQNMGMETGKLLEQVFKGHFSGSQLETKNQSETEKLLFGLRDTENNLPPTITAVTGVPSLSVDEREHFVQGLEKFIDAAEGKSYQALILAEPIGTQQLNLIQRGYESIATQLSPLLKQSLSFGENESESVGLSIGESISQSFGTSLSLTETKGTNESVTNTLTTGTNESFTKGENKSFTEGKSYSKTSASATTKGIAIGGTILSMAAGAIAGPVAAGAVGLATNMLSTAFNKSETVGTSSSSTYGTSNSTTTGTSTSESNAKTTGTSFSTANTKGTTENTSYSQNRNDSLTNTLGSSKQITLEIVDKSVEQLLKQVSHHLDRLDEARRYGGWHSAAYFITESSASSRALGSIFLGLMRGDDSNSEDFALTTWQSDKSKMLLPWLSNLTHPRLMSGLSKNLGIPYLTPATLVSGKEMAIQLSLPRRSTSTVTVVEAVPFGRRIQNVNGENSSAERIVNLGQVRHLWQNLPQKVELDVEKLSGHIFVTGSTGSGKSNTVYQLLDQLNQNNVKFLVIEPAKGEYKNVFGHRQDVQVFGTNPKQAALLRINPFKFPATGENAVHILEHIDRLIEIFSVCWTMYDAMPAMLKQAMLDAYQASGWNLEKSCNSVSDELFPNFADLLEALKKAIDKSDYSAEVKGNYKGALITRVESLTNGLNKQIFTANEIDNKVLFDENAIVDLSRIGSQETKSLIMGVLVMRLNEYRMSEAVGMNAKLKHITVLEEAHNILKNTQGSQGVGGANVMGKSVEMLSNAIAEMRTFGEGFIIADQSPSAVDISAIRNTNTKIVMRLPDETDRRLAGKASGVTDEQLEEIAKLPKGVAVVYQNDWLEPILCSVHHFKADEKAYKPDLTEQDSERKVFNTELAKFLLKQTACLDLDVLKEGAKRFDLPQNYRQGLLNSVAEFEQYGKARIWTDGTDLVNLLLSVFNSQQEALQHIQQSRELSELASKVEQMLNDHIRQETAVVQIVQNDLAELWKAHHNRGVM